VLDTWNACKPAVIFVMERKWAFTNGETANAQRMVNYCRSLDGVNRQLVAGLAETVAALEELAMALEATIAGETVNLYWSYRLWLAVR
jgi:hypothetical protein